MANGVNKAILIGNLGKDPEMRQAASGPVVNFSLATSEKVKDIEKVEWHRIVAFGKLAEICDQYLKKGAQIYVEGRIQYQQWEDRESGLKRYATNIVASYMRILGGGRKNDAAQEEAPPINEQDGDDDSRIPF